MVVVVIGILTALAFVLFTGNQWTATETTPKSDLKETAPQLKNRKGKRVAPRTTVPSYLIPT